MPIYDYNCPHCKANFEGFAKMKDSRRRKKCPHCGQRAGRIPRRPNLVTDTSFWGTGKSHAGTCDPLNPKDVLTGRADYENRMKKNGLRELDRAELEHPKMPPPHPCM